jgi:hypothetical protein
MKWRPGTGVILSKAKDVCDFAEILRYAQNDGLYGSE